MEAIRLQRFKGFVDSGWIDLKPITLLFGYNSSGKSSILNALLMLKQSLNNPSLEVPFVFTSKKGIDLGSYSDAVYNHEVDHRNPMVISLRVNIKSALTEKLEIRSNSFDGNLHNQLEMLPSFDIEFSVSISYNQKRRTNEIMGFNITDINEKIILKMWKSHMAHNAKEYFSSDYFSEFTDKKIQLEWYNFLPVIKNLSDGHPAIIIMNALREQVIESFENLSNIGPVRAIPERTQLFTGEEPLTVGTGGEEAFKLLYLSKYNNHNESTKLEEQVNKWLSTHNYKFEWNILSGNLGQFLLTDLRTGLRVSIKDVGFGLSQVLPIVIQAFYSSNKSTVLIEQPEIHLHARAQAELGDLLLDAINYKNNSSEQKKRIIIETHSENLLLRIRRRLAECYLNPCRDIDAFLVKENLAIYYIENCDGKSIANKVILNEKGQFAEMPKGFKKFFTDDFEEIMQINTVLAKIAESNSGN